MRARRERSWNNLVKTGGLSSLWQPSSWNNKPLRQALTFCFRSTFLVSWHCTPPAPSVHTGLGAEPDRERGRLQGRILKIQRSGVTRSNIWFHIQTRRGPDYHSPTQYREELFGHNSKVWQGSFKPCSSYFLCAQASVLHQIDCSFCLKTLWFIRPINLTKAIGMHLLLVKHCKVTGGLKNHLVLV